MTHLLLEGTINQILFIFILKKESYIKTSNFVKNVYVEFYTDKNFLNYSIRRGNWITLKMRKLIKSKKDINRERQKSLTLTPTRSDSSEGFLQLPHQDSQDSSSVGSNSLEDGQTLGTKKSSSECLNSLNV